MGKSRKMAHPSPVLPHVFKAIERADMIALSNCKEEDIRPILPCLVRMSLIAPIENTLESSESRKAILKILSGIETVNSMVALLSVDFVTLESDIKKEQQLRQKAGGIGSGGPQEGGVLVPNLINGLALEFECSEPLKRLRLLLSEIIFVMAQVKEARPSGGDWFHKECELFDNLCYFEEISDILSIGVSELPGLLNPGELAETLLHFSNSPHLICRIVANQADYFKEVLTSLIINGEIQDEETDGGLMRLNTIRTMCQMNPTMALHARNLCIENCRMPGLAIYLTLDAAKNKINSCGDMGSVVGDPNEVGDVVSFVTGLLLSPDQAQRSWFSNYIKNTQKRKYEQPHSGLSALRSDLSERLCALQVFRTTHFLPAPQIIPAVALLRLYTALKNLPAIELQEDKEVGPLLQLLTCQPPISASGVRFVSTGLCVLIACPQLLNTQENERKATEWIKWLVKEEVHFSGALGIWSSNFGALLLLVAIHFHVGQLSAILDLVSSSLGMKVLTRPNNLQTIKRIITQEVFTESVITSIAAKVSVTKGLNATMPGFLPAHCVFHLLKSRMFSRHKVNIKNWIYKQICSSKAPIHPILPQLIEVFVKSIVSNNSATQEATNDPITENEILAVFQLSSFSGDRKTKLKKSNTPKIRSIKTYVSLKQSDGDKFENFGASSFSDGCKNTDKAEVQCVLTSQLLLLYYLLLYEDLRVSSGVLATQHSSSKVITYSPSLFSQLPIRYLLSRAQKDQSKYAGLYSALLKLMAHHYPQLCLAQDWLYKPPSAPHGLLMPRIRVTSPALVKAMSQCASSPGLLLALLEKCLLLPSFELWTIAAVPLTSCLVHLLQDTVPRSVLDKYVLVWRRLNSIYPRRLWAMTVEGLRSDTPQGHCHSPPIKTPKLMGGVLPRKSLTEDDLVLDPLYVLRCDQRVFRRAPLLQLVVYMLEVYLLSSRTFLTQHQQSTVCNMPGKEEERDKLRGALILTQESAAMQILLESILTDDAEVVSSLAGDGSKLCLQEVQAVVFSYLHQAFIKDTTLAKLVHFQGYPRELLGPVVQGVPSMHIAVGLNWIPELLQLPHHQHSIKQHSSIQQLLFTLELTARLSSQNALPSTMSIARLTINVISTLISVLSSEGRLTVVRGSMTPLVTLGAVFSCLLPDIVNLLHSFARLARAHCSIQPAPAIKGGIQDSSDSGYDDYFTTALCDEEPMDCDDKRVMKDVRSPLEDVIVREVTTTFTRLSEAVASDSSLY